jgi:hypothetical protein
VAHSSPSAVTPEVEVLARVARLHLSPAESESLRDLLTRKLDWALLIPLADSHRLGPLLHRHVEALAGDFVPPDARAALWALARSIASRNERRLLELRGLVAALDSAGIEAVLIKGPALAFSLFGDVGLRPFEDLDLLVPPARVHEAQRVLRQRGYRPEYEQPRPWDEWIRRNADVMPYVSATAGTTCDLHWQLRSEAYTFVVPQEQVRQRLEWLDIGGLRYRVLGAEDTLSFLLLHGLQAGWPALGWLADAAELIRARPGLDWGIVGVAARGRRRILQIGLRLAAQVLAAPVPAWVLAIGDADPELPSLVEEARASVLRPTPEPSLSPGVLREVFDSVYARSLETAADRLYFVYEYVLKPRPADVMAVPLPRWAWPAYFGIRPVRLALKHVGRGVRGLWRRGADSSGAVPKPPSE